MGLIPEHKLVSLAKRRSTCSLTVAVIMKLCFSFMNLIAPVFSQSNSAKPQHLEGFWIAKEVVENGEDVSELRGMLLVVDKSDMFVFRNGDDPGIDCWELKGIECIMQTEYREVNAATATRTIDGNVMPIKLLLETHRPEITGVPSLPKEFNNLRTTITCDMVVSSVNAEVQLKTQIDCVRISRSDIKSAMELAVSRYGFQLPIAARDRLANLLKSR